MRKANYKGKCIKKSIEKCKEICKLYDQIQSEYIELLQANDDIIEIQCNVLMNASDEGVFTSDFLCKKGNGDLLVRECCFRKLLSRPSTLKRLDASREYWLNHGVTDWGLVFDAEE